MFQVSFSNYSAGYTGPVVAVDTFIAILNNPSLCDASDYIAANAHAYFDGGVSASGAGAWVAQQASKLSSLCGGKDVLITGVSSQRQF
jgi:exo-beta-1,3-glucanase (GH17 family)